MAEEEREFPEHILRRQSGVLQFKPRFVRLRIAGTTLAIFFAQPGSPPLTEATMEQTFNTAATLIAQVPTRTGSSSRRSGLYCTPIPDTHTGDS